MTLTIAFDLDGTLVDTAADVADLINPLFAELGRAPITAAQAASCFGLGAAKFVERALALTRGQPLSPDRTAALVAAFGTVYASAPPRLSRPFPHVPETLAACRARGWRLAVCTNKPEAPARSLLAALGVLDRFDAVGAGDSFSARKPDPAHLAATLAAAGAAAREAVMVGDHANDIAVARGLGVPAIFAGWGYGRPAMAEGAAAIARSFAEIPALAARWRGN